MNASEKVRQDVRYTLGRDLVATWLNVLAGNPIDAAMPPAGMDTRDQINEAIDWLQALTPDQDGDRKGDGYLAGMTGNEVASSPAIAASSPYWNSGISGATGLPAPYNLNTAVQYPVNAGNSIHTALDRYNNTGYGADGAHIVASSSTLAAFMDTSSSSTTTTATASLSPSDLSGWQRTSADAFLDLTALAVGGATLSFAVDSDASYRNRLGFVKVNGDTDPVTGQLLGSVTTADGRSIRPGEAGFQEAVRAAMLDPDGGVYHRRSGRPEDAVTLTLRDDQAGFYAPVLISETNHLFTFGSNTAADGREHVRLLGSNAFGFEDMLASSRTDWDYNDLTVRLTDIKPVAPVLA